MHKEKQSSDLVSERRVRWLLTLVLAGLAILAASFFYAGGGEDSPGDTAGAAPVIVIENPRIVRPLAAGRPAAGYFTLRNEGEAPVRLLGAEGPGDATVDLHESVQDGDQARMRSVPGLSVPAGGEAVFQRGGLHLMIRGADFSAEALQLTLIFEEADAVPVDFRIISLGGED